MVLLCLENEYTCVNVPLVTPQEAQCMPCNHQLTILKPEAMKCKKLRTRNSIKHILQHQ